MKLTLCFTVFLIGYFSCFGQLPKTDSLFQIIEKHDRLLFDAAFNLRDADELSKYLSADLEFYHDKGGLIAESADVLVSSFEGNWNKMKSGNKKFQRRESVEGSIEIYPLNNFGAMVMGEHKFYEYEKNGQEMYDSNAKYLTIWKNENGHWKASRIVSYDHQFPK